MFHATNSFCGPYTDEITRPPLQGYPGTTLDILDEFSKVSAKLGSLHGEGNIGF